LATSEGDTISYPALGNPSTSEKLYFGFRVLLSSANVLLISAHGEDVLTVNGTFADAGAVYKFTRNASGYWEYKDKILAPTITADAQFGYNMAHDSGLLAISAPIRGPAETITNYGSVHLYNLDSSANHTFSRSLHPATAASTLQYGSAVHILGNLIAVGAPLANELRGAVYLYNSAGTQLGPILSPGGANNLTANDEFGNHVQMTNAQNNKVTLWVASSGRENKLGAIYKLDTSTVAGGTASPSVQFILRPRLPRAQKGEFGKSFMISGSEILVGSPAKTADNLTNAGLGYVIATP
jgi:hypothetical protein